MAFGIQVQFDSATASQVRSAVQSLATIASSMVSEQAISKSIEASLSAIAKAIETPSVDAAVSIRLALPRDLRLVCRLDAVGPGVARSLDHRVRQCRPEFIYAACRHRAGRDAKGDHA